MPAAGVGFFSHSISSMHKTFSHTHSFSQKKNPTDSYRNPKKETNDFLEIILTTTTTNLILQRSQTR
jgi:hypothetical protein